MIEYMSMHACKQVFISLFAHSCVTVTVCTVLPPHLLMPACNQTARSASAWDLKLTARSWLWRATLISFSQFSATVSRPRMVRLGVWCAGAQWSILIVVFCSILVPSPTHAYIYAVSILGAVAHGLIHFTDKSDPSNSPGEITSILMYVLFWQHYSNMTSMLFEDLPALFGAPLPKEGLMVSRLLENGVHTEKHNS